MLKYSLFDCGEAFQYVANSVTVKQLLKSIF